MSAPSADPDRQRQRLRWQCRRGMLELDLLLTGFLDQGYDALDPAAQRVFERLLRCPDPVIHDWLMGHDEPEEAQMQELVGRILAAVIPRSSRPGPG